MFNFMVFTTFHFYIYIIINDPKMSYIPKVIGEGTYGCVHDGSLECKDVDMDYTNKVSKILLNKHAKSELDEYLGIQRADPEHQFFLGVPFHCKPKQTPRNYIAVNKCKMGPNAINGRYNLINPEYDLLIMENGGMNLRDFAKSMEGKPATSENQKIMENFWIECHRLFLGLSVFLKENIMHHDLKAENIVYNPNTNRAAFIDFGLMRPQDAQRARILREEKLDELMHWSYPVETMFYKKPFYESTKIKNIILDKLDSNLDAVYDIHFLNNVLPQTDVDDDVVKRMTMEAILYYSMVDLIKSNSTTPHQEFLDKSLATFDQYGMSMGLMYVFKKTFHLLKETNSKIDYIELFTHLLYCFRPDSSRYTVEQSLQLYEERVLASILRDDHIIFINHVPTKIEPPPHLRVPKMSDVALEKSVEKEDAKLRKKICPAGKVLNPFTGRCVKECAEGQQRDEKFRCKSAKNTATATVEGVCPEGKERNPITKRCVAKCKPGVARDDKFRCKSTKKRGRPRKSASSGKSRRSAHV
jgi:hypothetical protein